MTPPAIERAREQAQAVERVKVLEAALKPFADALGVDALEDRRLWPDNETIEYSGAAECITWGHLRAARALLETDHG